MKHNIDKAYIDKIHKSVPVDYYEQGIKNNLLQKYWHSIKLITIKKFIKNIPNYNKLLDLGCHSGLLTSQLKESLNVDIDAIDISKDAINYAKQKYPEINFRTADMQDGFPYQDNSFDVVTAFDVLEHVPEPHKNSLEIKRILKNGGYLIIGIPNENLLFKIVWFFWTHLKGKVWEDVHVNDFNDVLLSKVFTANGFEKVDSRKIHLNMWHIVKYRVSK